MGIVYVGAKATNEGCFALGTGAKATGIYSFALGSSSLFFGRHLPAAEANGQYSYAIGPGAKAEDIFSLALGFSSTASGQTATAIQGATASGNGSFAFGTGTVASGGGGIAIGSGGSAKASGISSIVIGYGTLAKSYRETAIGCFNTDYTPQSTTEWNVNDRLFVIGNGQNNNNRNDVLTIYKNGKTVINGILETTTAVNFGGDISGTSLSTTGTASIGGNLKVSGSVTSTLKPSGTSYDLGGTSNRWNYVYGQTGDFNTSSNQTAVNAKNSHTQKFTYGVNAEATGTKTVAGSTNYGVKGVAKNAIKNYGVYGEAPVQANSYALYANGNAGGSSAWDNTSDGRLKKDVQTLTGALDKVLKLRGVSFYWKNREEMASAKGISVDNFDYTSTASK